MYHRDEIQNIPIDDPTVTISIIAVGLVAVFAFIMFVKNVHITAKRKNENEKF